MLAASPAYDLTGNLLGDKANTVVFDNSKLKRAVPGFKARWAYRDGVALALLRLISAVMRSANPRPAFDPMVRSAWWPSCKKPKRR
jgi:hypothetical protein